MEEKSAPRRHSKKDQINILLGMLENWIKQGETPEQAIDHLTEKQYDLLAEDEKAGEYIDKLLLSPEQLTAISSIRRAPRPKGLNYKLSKSGEVKKPLFGLLTEFLQSIGAEITPREKENFRDVSFDWEGINYHIVLSIPNPKKQLTKQVN